MSNKRKSARRARRSLVRQEFPASSDPPEQASSVSEQNEARAAGFGPGDLDSSSMKNEFEKRCWVRRFLSDVSERFYEIGETWHFGHSESTFNTEVDFFLDGHRDLPEVRHHRR